MIFRETYLQKPVTVLMLFILFVLFGLISFVKLPVSLMPEQKTPWLSIIVEYPGVSPQKIEGLITKPLEEKLAVIAGIKKIESVSEEGKSRVNVQFDWSKDIDFAVLELRENVDMVKTSFPREVQEPQIIKYDPSQAPVLILSLWSRSLDTEKLRDFAEHKLKKLIQRIDGVSEIFISGGLQREIHVDVDMYRLYSRNLDIQDIFREVQFANLYLSTGRIYRNRLLMPLLAPWKYTSLEQIRDTAVAFPEDGRTIKVKDVAWVKDTFKEQDSLSRVNLQKRIAVYIEKSGIANTVTVVDGIMKEVKRWEKQYKEIDFRVVYDQAGFIRNALNQMRSAVLLGSLIAGLVLYLFLRSFKTTMLVGLSIPVSIVTTFIFFYMKKISLNVFSLSGLALAAGMLVDNSIIVLENISLRRKVAPAVLGVEKSILASTLTTMAVFLPVVFTNKQTQLLYGDITFAISFSIFFSMVVSLILLPVLYHVLDKARYAGPDLKKIMAGPVKRARFLYEFIKNRVPSFFFMINSGSYKKMLKKALHHPGRVLLAALGLVLLAGLIAPSLRQEYMDPLDTGNVRVFIELPSGTNLEETDRVVRSVETKIYSGLKKHIKRISARIEKAHSTLVIELNRKHRISTTRFIRKSRDLVKSVKDADIIFSEPSEASDMGQKELTVFLTGREPERIRSLAAELAGVLKGIKYVTEIIFHFKEAQEQITVTVDREKAALNHLDSRMIANYLREVIYGPVTTKYFDSNREIDVRVKFDRSHITGEEDLRNIRIRNKAGDLIPLISVCSIERSKAPGKIYRLNRHRAESFTLKYEKTDLYGIVRLVERKLREVPFPDRYYYEFGENYRNLIQNRGEMLGALLIALILIYLILASIFEDCYYPVIIILTIPVALASVILTLFLTGNSLNISVYIGLIMLGGIVVNNSILLLETINQLLIEKVDLYQALQSACILRLRPIFMTTLTTVLGLLPILVFRGEGSNLWQPLALTIISGLSASTVLTLFITPAAYLYSSKKGLIKKL